MNSNFPRIITLLRKEKKISQKQAAENLGISQALLSHYEKGIRECGLDFVVRAAKFYDVSCDYLLGLSPERSGQIISVDEIPEPETAVGDNVFRGSVIPVLNKKLISNSLNIIFAYLQRCDNKALVSELSSFLMLSVYKAFRMLYLLNPQNEKSFFTIPHKLAQAAADAKMHLSEAKIEGASEGENQKFRVVDIEEFKITTETLQKEFPLFCSSLTNLIGTCETALSEITESRR